MLVLLHAGGALLAGLILLAAAEVGLAAALGTTGLDKLASASGAAVAVVGIALLAAAAGLLVRRPALVLVAVLIAAPFRPPLEFDSSNRLLVSVAEDGRLGRLLPLYFVLAAAAAALAWRGLRG